MLSIRAIDQKSLANKFELGTKQNNTCHVVHCDQAKPSETKLVVQTLCVYGSVGHVDMPVLHLKLRWFKPWVNRFREFGIQSQNCILIVFFLTSCICKTMAFLQSIMQKPLNGMLIAR